MKTERNTPNKVCVVVMALALFLIFRATASGADQGESLYKERCASCHGTNGDGNGHAQMKVRPQDLRSENVQKKSDEDLYNAIALGVGHSEYAHAFSKRGMSSEQISQVVAYIRTFAKPSKKNR